MDVEARINWLMLAEQWDEIISLLDQLSHSAHRKACKAVAQNAASIDRTAFWTFTLKLVQHDSRAYLGTMLKVAPPIQWASNRMCTQGLGCEAAERLLDYIALSGTEVDVSKTLTAMLPRQTAPEDIERLFIKLNVAAPAQQAAYLVKCATMPMAYALFQCMRCMDAEREWLLSLCRRLMHDDTPIGWLLASLARIYFDLPELRGTFSLCLQPYELSRIETSYEAFCSLR